jgi:hypothetical protein
MARPSINPNFTIRPDARARPARVLHHGSRYDVRYAPSTGRYGCFDVVLVRKASFSGNAAKQPVEVVRAWRNRESWRGKPDSPFQQALAEAHALRDELDPDLVAYKR